MAVFFKISVDGRLVYVAKTLLSNVITEEEFEKKANAMSIEEILLRFPAKVSAELKMGIKRVNEIKNMRLSKIGCKYTNGINNEIKGITYYIGNRIFEISDINDKNILQKQKKNAYEHGVLIYGEQFMLDNAARLDSTDFMYLTGDYQITEEIYIKLKNEHKNLTSIRILKNDIKLNSKVKKH